MMKQRIYSVFILTIVLFTNTIAQDSPIFPKGELAPNVNHTGNVWLYELVKADAILDVHASVATFDPGARLNWHKHPGGQILLITEGTGYYQEKNQPKKIVSKGDVVKCLPNVAHWHGASPDEGVTYLAINANNDKGKTVWLQKLTDEEYSSEKTILSDRSNIEQEIINLSKQKWQWMADKNADTLSDLFHEKSMFVHMGGSWGKEREIDVIRSGGIWYKHAKVYSATVNIIGNTAILLNDIDLVAVVGGNEVINPFMVTEVYINENGKWKMGSLTFSKLMRPVKLSKKPGLEKIWESDSLTLQGPESVLYDPVSNSLYVSSMKAGTIVRMDTAGKVINKDWVTGLVSNKGSALFNGFFYTAETTSVAVIDIKKSTVVKRIPVEGAQMLNDLAIDSKGIIYVTDTRAGKVYRIEDDKPMVYLENMPGANGLLTVDTDLYVLTSTSIQKVNADKEITKIADGFESGLDGIVMVAPNEFVISNYKGILYYLNADGTNQVLQNTRDNKIMSNDIAYNSKTKILYVPSFGTNRVIAYKLK